MADRDPDIQALFAAADKPLDTPDFTERVMAQMARAERLRLWRRGALAGLVAFAIWALSLEALPFILSQSLLDPANFGLGGHWIADALSPLNSPAGVLTLLLLGVRGFYRRLFG